MRTAAVAAAVATAVPAPAYASLRPEGADRMIAGALGDLFERDEGLREIAGCGLEVTRPQLLHSVRSNRRYRANSAWHRRHDSTWRSTARLRASSSTRAGSKAATSSHRMGFFSLVVQHVLQLSPAPMQPNLGRRDGDVELGGDVFV